LAADEREPHAEFEEKPPEMFHETGFELALAGVLGEREKVEVVRVL
jgi:hypothetical protein